MFDYIRLKVDILLFVIILLKGLRIGKLVFVCEFIKFVSGDLRYVLIYFLYEGEIIL